MDARHRRLRSAILVLTLSGSAACGGGGGSGGTDAGGTDNAPRIARVAWTHAGGCTPGTVTAVTVIATVNDTDTPATALAFSGQAQGCTGMFAAAMSNISCPGNGSHPASIAVTDPEGNSDSVSFTIDACTDGSVSP